MTENNLILSDQIAGYPHPKFTENLFGHDFADMMSLYKHDLKHNHEGRESV